MQCWYIYASRVGHVHRARDTWNEYIPTGLIIKFRNLLLSRCRDIKVHFFWFLVVFGAASLLGVPAYWWSTLPTRSWRKLYARCTREHGALLWRPLRWGSVTDIYRITTSAYYLAHHLVHRLITTSSTTSSTTSPWLLSFNDSTCCC